MAKVLVVTSGKGGVGKTTSTAAIGAGLASLGANVAVVDFDVGLRNLDLIMGAERRVVFDLINVVQGDAKLSQALIRDKRLDTLHLLPASQTRDKDALTSDGVTRVMAELRERFDWVICDSPAGIERGAQLAMYHADLAVVVTNPEVSSVRDSDRIIGMLDSKTARAERGERVDKHLLLTRYDPLRAQRGDMLRTEDVLEILSIPLARHHSGKPGRAEGQQRRLPGHAGRPQQPAGPGLHGRGPAAGRRERGDVDPRRAPRPVQQAVRAEGRVSLFSWIRNRNTAPVARERLKMVLAHERVGNTHSQLVAVLQEEILAVIAKHMQIDRDKVNVKLDRGDDVNTLEIDIEMPSSKLARV